VLPELIVVDIISRSAPELTVPTVPITAAKSVNGVEISQAGAVLAIQNQLAVPEANALYERLIVPGEKAAVELEPDWLNVNVLEVGVLTTVCVPLNVASEVMLEIVIDCPGIGNLLPKLFKTDVFIVTVTTLEALTILPVGVNLFVPGCDIATNLLVVVESVIAELENPKESTNNKSLLRVLILVNAVTKSVGGVPLKIKICPNPIFLS
jgi:hypothetical protein